MSKFRRERSSSSSTSSDSDEDRKPIKSEDHEPDQSRSASAWKQKDRSDFGRSYYKASGKTTQKDTFHCVVCDVELNSVETRISHASGRRHIENVERYGYPSETIIAINNPAPINRKEVQLLGPKIKESAMPAVGLKFINEYIPVTSTESIDPAYECTLCDTSGDASGIFNHVVGEGHKKELVKYYSSQGQRPDIKAENRKVDKLVKTILGDELFPWPPGKAPWSIEQGGDGIPPPEARRKFGTAKKKSKTFLLQTATSMGEISKENYKYAIAYGCEVATLLKDYNDQDDYIEKDILAEIKEFTDAIKEIVDYKKKTVKKEPKGEPN